MVTVTNNFNTKKDLKSEIMFYIFDKYFFRGSIIQDHSVTHFPNQHIILGSSLLKMLVVSDAFTLLSNHETILRPFLTIYFGGFLGELHTVWSCLNIYTFSLKDDLP